MKHPDLEPHLACTVDDRAHGLVGYLVVHNLVGGRSLGGVRLVADVNLEEMRWAARSMAYKYGFIGLPMGGAKAAVRIVPPDDSLADDAATTSAYRREMLTTFGKALSPLIATGAYGPGIDMNCTLEDLQHVMCGAGLERDWSWRTIASHQYTAWTCYICTLVGLEALGIEPGAATFAVQGFGRVGGAYAALMTDAGAKCVAVSNRLGALTDEGGLEVADLLQDREREGDRFIVTSTRGEQVSSDEVLAAPVSVLLPAARGWAIHEDNWRDIRAPLIVSAANVSMDDAIERLLFDHDRIVVTDFVANCGGVLGSMLDRELEGAAIWHVLNTAYRNKITGLVALSRSTGQTICSLARGEVEDRIAGWQGTGRRGFEKHGRRLRKLLPRRMRAAFHQRFYESLWNTGDRGDAKVRR